MPGDFAQGALAAQEVNKSNPFSVIMSSFLDAQARRYKEDQARKSEEADLFKSLTVLNKDYLYKTELEKIRGEEDRKTATAKQEEGLSQTQKLLETFGVSGGANFPPGTTVKAGNFTIPLNPKLSQEQGASVAASTRVEEDVSQLKILIEKHSGEPGAIAKTTLPYFMVGGETEETKRLSDQLRARIPFAKGGKQLTPFEAKTLFKLLPQPGQSKETIVKNLDSFVDEFKRMSEIALKGTAGAGQGKKQNGQMMIDTQGNKAMVYSDGSFEEIK